MEINRKTTAWLVYVVALTLALVWVGGAVVAPLLAANAEGASLASTIYYAYGRVCHQIAERSFHLLGHPCAVCARCMGIYAGYVFGLMLYPLARRITREDTPPRAWLILALVPVAVDFLGGYVGAFENTLASRAITGLVAGAAGAFYTLPGLVSLAVSAVSPAGGYTSAKESS